MDVSKIKLNYLELAFIVEKPSWWARELFDAILDKNVSRKDLVEVKDLVEFFDPIRSVDVRYDGINSLIFYLQHKSSLYKRYLSHHGVIKKGALVGGKSVLWKIMNQTQKDHFNMIIQPKYKFYQSGKR